MERRILYSDTPQAYLFRYISSYSISPSSYNDEDDNDK